MLLKKHQLINKKIQKKTKLQPLCVHYVSLFLKNHTKNNLSPKFEVWMQKSDTNTYRVRAKLVEKHEIMNISQRKPLSSNICKHLKQLFNQKWHFLKKIDLNSIRERKGKENCHWQNDKKVLRDLIFDETAYFERFSITFG